MDKIECIMNTCSAVASITGETEISIQEVLRLLNQPIDKFNHLLDALRYCTWTKFGQNAGYGTYSISFNRRR